MVDTDPVAIFAAEGRISKGWMGGPEIRGRDLYSYHVIRTPGTPVAVVSA